MRAADLIATLPPSLDALVVALCADYKRREDELLKEDLPLRVKAELCYLNYIIREAAAEIADERYVFDFINDIGKRIGYAHSEIFGMSETTYKTQKIYIKMRIAKRLHLYI